MIIRVPIRGIIEVNCYLYASEKTRHAFLIDPGAQGEKILAWLRQEGYVVEKILLTHGHFDHIGGLKVLGEREGIPVWIHEAGDAYLKDPRLNLSREIGNEIVFSGAQLFRDGDVFRLEADPSYELKVIHTPGHTPDSVLFYSEAEGFAFSGDTIFRGSRGNDSFPGGDGRQLIESIRTRVLTLPENTALYPGHGEPTTVGAEKRWYRGDSFFL